MSSNLLTRNIPQETDAWLRRESERRNVSKNAFVLSVLEKAREVEKGPSLFDALERQPSAAPSQDSISIPFSFIDLFSGIGGLRIGLEKAGGQCRFSCEIDPFARRTYHAWFGETPERDVRDFVSGEHIPSHDVLAAGFPCQPFSIAGVSKKNSLGRAHGFKDKAQGTLFFHLATIIENTKPPVLLLENVKNLKSHNRGDTWATISERLSELGYRVFAKIIDARHYVPQHRERIFIVGFRRDIFGSEPPFEFPSLPEGQSPVLRQILLPESEVDKKYILTSHLWEYLQAYAKRHQEKGNGFGFGLANLDGVTRTLSARYYKDGSEVLIPRRNGRPRRLTPVEAGRLMGFPERLLERIVVSDTQAYKQFGNAVVPIVAEAVARKIVEVLRWHLLTQGKGSLIAGVR